MVEKRIVTVKFLSDTVHFAYDNQIAYFIFFIATDMEEKCLRTLIGRVQPIEA